MGMKGPRVPKNRVTEIHTGTNVDPKKKQRIELFRWYNGMWEFIDDRFKTVTEAKRFIKTDWAYINHRDYAAYRAVVFELE